MQNTKNIRNYTYSHSAADKDDGEENTEARSYLFLASQTNLKSIFKASRIMDFFDYGGRNHPNLFQFLYQSPDYSDDISDQIGTLRHDQFLQFF